MADSLNRFVIVRDTACLIGGLAGIAFQQITNQINPLLIGVYMTMLGLPGLASGRWLLKQIGTPPSSSHPSAQSVSDSPSSSDT